MKRAKADEVAKTQAAFDKAQADAANAQKEFDKLKADSEAQEKAAASAKLEAAKRTEQSANDPKLEKASKALEDAADALQRTADEAEERAHMAAMAQIEKVRAADRLRDALDAAFLLYALAQQNSFRFSPGYAPYQGGPQVIQSYTGGFVQSSGAGPRSTSHPVLLAESMLRSRSTRCLLRWEWPGCSARWSCSLRDKVSIRR